MAVTDIVINPQLTPDVAEQLQRQAAQLDSQLDQPYDGPQPIAATGVLEQLGRLLWSATDLDAEDLLEAIGEAQDSETPVRLVVANAAYHHLPWELLCHDHPRLGFVARHPWCVVMRRFEGRGQRQPTRLPRPFRLLLFVASPEDLDAERGRLDFEREEELLFTALDGPIAAGEVSIDVAEDGALDTLVGRLDQQRYHAVILSLHGTQSRDRNGEPEWGLLFEDVRTGRSDAVTGSVLAERLQELPTGHRPGLVVLSACRSATVEESAESITSVALRLHESGFERVLGMRLSVLDTAASAFSAELFRRAARGESLGRAVTLARCQVARGEWLGAPAPKGAVDGDVYAQWTLPVLLDRTADGALVDMAAEVELEERPPPPEIIPGDHSVHISSRAAFIGRRRFMRQYLRPFLQGKTRQLFFTGPGGVGKTTLAGWFARKLSEQQPRVRLLGFRAPFDLKTVADEIRQATFDGAEPPGLQDQVNMAATLEAQLQLMLTALASRAERPCAFVLDNLESLQELGSLEVASEHADSLFLLDAICKLPAPTRVLLTGRYAFNTVADSAITCPVQEAPYGDVLRRMRRLHWPRAMNAEEKQAIYQVLGGNHRAIEWMAQLLTDAPEKSAELVAALEAMAAPANTPENAMDVVLEAMRQNLLLTELRRQLTPGQDHLLRAACLYRVPVNADGLLAIAADAGQTAAHRERLVAYALLETPYDLDLDLTYFVAPPVARELIGADGFDAAEQRELHRAMGTYHRFQGAYLSRRVSDYTEAIYHFRCAGEHITADELAEPVCSFYYGRSNFAASVALTEEIVSRVEPPASWWVLNRHGMCQFTLGFANSALDHFERARTAASTQDDLGTTLNNIGRIYDARGDYDTALTYLQQSLQIRQEIGDKAGEGTTLNNISGIYRARGDYDTALTYLQQSLQIQQEIGDKAGEGTTLNNISGIYRARGDYDTALTYLQQSLQIQQEIGDKAGEGTTLNNISQIYDARGDYDTALTYLQQSLQIQQEIGDKAGEGATLNNISQIYDARGDYDTALTYLQQSLQIQQEIGDKAGEGTTLNNISQIYDARGDYDTALTYLQQSLQIRQEIGDKAGEGATLNNISLIYRARGDCDTALTYLQQSLQIRQEIGDKAGEGATLNNISLIYRARGDCDTALTYLQQSLRIQQEIGDKSAMVATLHNMAHLALQANDAKQAISLWSQALSLAMETQDAMGIFNVAGTLGAVLAQAGAHEQARQLLHLAVDVGRRAGFPDVGDYEAILRQFP